MEDVSILIPLSNLNFRDFQLVQSDGLLNSQIHIKWSDSVNAAITMRGPGSGRLGSKL